MKPEYIGNIILESSITGFEKTNIIKEENGHVIAEGVLQTVEEKNRNGRIYTKQGLFPQLTCPRILELLEAGYLRAELGHPLSKELSRQQLIDDSRTCAQFLKLWTEGDDIWARFRGTNNSFGEVFDKDLRDGCKPAWSLRALGSIKRTPQGDLVENAKIITWDQVIYPSHPSAYTRRLVTESGSVELTGHGEIADDPRNEAKVIPITNSNVLSYIRSESANFKYLKENFDFMYDDITMNLAEGSVSLTTKDGEILVINLETYIHNEIMDYCDETLRFRYDK